MILSYDKVQQFGLLCCELQREAKGDNFATETEMKSIRGDIFGWSELWFPELVSVLSLKDCGRNDWFVDHYKKTIEIYDRETISSADQVC